MLMASYGMGDDGGYSSLKLDFSFSVKQWIHAFSPRIHAQYFTGYGQTLRQYNRYSHGLRVGFSLFD
jgi:outer membrane phospholipase A